MLQDVNKMPSHADKRIIVQEITGFNHYISKKAKISKIAMQYGR